MQFMMNQNNANNNTIAETFDDKIRAIIVNNKNIQKKLNNIEAVCFRICGENLLDIRLSDDKIYKNILQNSAK